MKGKYDIELNDSLIFDVGMHKGEDTEYYLLKGFKVVGIEANPELIEFCKKKFKNEIINGKLNIIEGAISEKIGTNGKIKFYINLSNTVWGTTLNSWVKRNEKYGTKSKLIEINAVDFEECLKISGIPYYLKIDIEGMDTFCLKKLENFIQKPKYVSLEMDITSIIIAIRQINILSKIGYNKFQLINQADICKYKEPAFGGEKENKDYDFTFGSSGLFGKDLPLKWRNKYLVFLNLISIFLFYFIFSTNRSWSDWKIFKFLKVIFFKLFHVSIPGWHDIHAFRKNNY